MALFAEGTRVPVAQSVAEIERVLVRYGADSFLYGSKHDRAVIMFTAKKRNMRFELPLPRAANQSEERHAQECRRRWRAVLMVIKAKLEAVASGICTFEEEFLAHIVLPNGKTVSEQTLPLVAQAYGAGQVGPLLEWGGPR
jgi:hypothetical protein